MRTNFNFKSQWLEAVNSVDASFRLMVFQVISFMGIQDVDLDEALSALGVVVDDDGVMALLLDVDKVLRRRRRARERAALRREALRRSAGIGAGAVSEGEAVAEPFPEPGSFRAVDSADVPADRAEAADAVAVPVQQCLDFGEADMSDGNAGETARKRRRHNRNKKRNKWRRMRAKAKALRQAHHHQYDGDGLGY